MDTESEQIAYARVVLSVYGKEETVRGQAKRFAEYLKVLAGDTMVLDGIEWPDGEYVNAEDL